MDATACFFASSGMVIGIFFRIGEKGGRPRGWLFGRRGEASGISYSMLREIRVRAGLAGTVALTCLAAGRAAPQSATTSFARAETAVMTTDFVRAERAY